MIPSRELDALIAEHVFGWELKNDPRPGFEHIPRRWKKPNGDWTTQVPFYSTDICAAWEVIEKLIQKYDVEICHLIYHGMGDAKGWFIKLNGDRVGLPHETLPHAICLAALKAVGYENKR